MKNKKKSLNLFYIETNSSNDFVYDTEIKI